MEAHFPRTDRRPPRFASTCWTTIRACVGNDKATLAARQELCSAYWYPVYAYISRSGHQEQDAADLTQAFFADILNRPWFSRVDRSKGKFRSFLLASVNNFLRDHAKHKKAFKRSGLFQHIPLDLTGIKLGREEIAEPSNEPAAVYELEWAAVIVGTAIKRLEEEYTGADKQALYRSLKIYLTVAGETSAYETAAAELSISVENVKVSVHRLRKRYGDILRDEVARTIGDYEDVEDEMRHMRAVLIGVGTPPKSGKLSLTNP